MSRSNEQESYLENVLIKIADTGTHIDYLCGENCNLEYPSPEWISHVKETLYKGLEHVTKLEEYYS